MVSEMARYMMLHSYFLWKIALVKSCLQWTLVIPPIFTIICTMMRTQSLLISSLELNFLVTSLYIFTCGVFLSMSWIPRFQQGHKLPKCQPRSHHRIFFGFSPNHSSYVPLILNPATGRISPQLHAILMIPSDQSYIFLSRNNLLLCVMNFLSMVFSTWRLLIKIPRLLYMHNYSLIMNQRREIFGRFVLIICFAVS